MKKNDKVNSMFNNNLDKVDPRVLLQIKRELDLLKKRVFKLEDILGRKKNE